jgi:long-subunit acyl-CoA synthetase (AMP-forming)
MKKLLLILLCLPLLFSTCSKSDVTPQPQSLENVIVGIEWSLSNENEDGFLLAEDGKFYLTQKCQSNTHFGNWERIKRFELTPDVWSIDSGHLTPTMKMKREVIKNTYTDLYDKIYLK